MIEHAGARRDLADAMGLERVNPDADPRAVDVPFALYDGSQFVLNQSDWTVLTMLRMGLLQVHKGQVSAKRQPSMTDRMLVGQRMNSKELRDEDVRR